MCQITAEMLFDRMRLRQIRKAASLFAQALNRFLRISPVWITQKFLSHESSEVRSEIDIAKLGYYPSLSIRTPVVTLSSLSLSRVLETPVLSATNSAIFFEN